MATESCGLALYLGIFNLAKNLTTEEVENSYYPPIIGNGRSFIWLQFSMIKGISGNI
jgi:hypothetical protein